VDTGSREENASKNPDGASVLIPSEPRLHLAIVEELCRLLVTNVDVTSLFLDGSVCEASAAPVSVVVPPTLTSKPPWAADAPLGLVTDF
jgi:hypothetical protein